MDASCSSASNCGIITYYKFNKMKEKVTLVVVDFQYDFCLLGAPLYVPGSDKALWNISHLIENNKVGRVIFTADWHPSNHCSFKKNGGQWNEHCVQFSKGAAIHDLLLYGCIGADRMAQDYLLACGVSPKNINVYHMLKAPRYLANHNIPTIGGYTSDLQRDEAMTKNSDYDIAFIRKGRETSGTAQNILRRWTK